MADTALSSIFGGGGTSGDTQSSSTESSTGKEDTSSNEQSKESASSSDKPKEEKSADKVPVGDNTSDEKKAGEKKEDNKKSDDKKEEKKADDQKKADSKSDDKKTEDSNKQSSEESFEKRWKDTAAWANNVHQKNLQLERQMTEQARQLDILKKQIADPDYDPATDPAHAGPSQEDIANASITVGKTLASRNAAYEKFGQEKVDSALTEFHGIFGQNQIIQQVVRDSESPVIAAMDIVERFHFEQKYGDRPQAIYENIKKELEPELRKAIRAELLEEFSNNSDKKDRNVKGLSSSRSGNGLDKGQNAKSSSTPLNQIFK